MVAVVFKENGNPGLIDTHQSNVSLFGQRFGVLNLAMKR
jgi:hypothetical protein